MSSVQIIVGSMLGSSEYVAEAVRDVLEDAGHTVQLHFKPDFDNVATEGQIWLICTSTHGTGELPDSIKTFAEKVEATDRDLSDLQFSVIGLGDSGYDSYCQAATIMEELMLAKKSKLLLDKFLIDARDVSSEAEDKAEDWVKENIACF